MTWKQYSIMLGGYDADQLARAARLHKNSPVMSKHINDEVARRNNPRNRPKRSTGYRPS